MYVDNSHRTTWGLNHKQEEKTQEAEQQERENKNGCEARKTYPVQMHRDTPFCLQRRRLPMQRRNFTYYPHSLVHEGVQIGRVDARSGFVGSHAGGWRTAVERSSEAYRSVSEETVSGSGLKQTD